MKLAISNIAWIAEQDVEVYKLMQRYGYSGLEIAPTRILPESPYDKIESIQKWFEDVKDTYGFCVPSMQSIWYGRTEKIFGTPEERKILLDYTKKAIDFASAIGCKNLVFGCPRNRVIGSEDNEEIAIGFFRELGDYAFEKGTVVGMEANPPMYQTNYINDTKSALRLIKKVDSKGFLLNLDVGTMIENKEDVSELCGQIKYVNHVHISEPGLKKIEQREMHCALNELLQKEGYDGFVSVEMAKQPELDAIREVLEYVEEVF